MRKYNSRNKRKSNVKRNYLWLVAAISLIVLIIVLLEITNTTHIFHKSNPAVSTTPSTNSTSNISGTASQPTNKKTYNKPVSEKNPSVASPGTTGSFSGNIIAPYGRFVSQHSPPSSSYIEQTACITSAGATCSISFSLNGKTIILSPKVTDSSGSAYWSWTTKQYGLTKGSWTITATATGNGQSKSTIDPNGKLLVP